MGHVTVQLTAAQEAMLEERISAGEFASLDQYVAALIAAETKARAQERLEELLLEGLSSPSLAWTPELMDDIRRAARLKS